MISRRRDRPHPFRIAFWLTVGLACAGWLLDRYPITLGSGDPEVPAAYQFEDARSDILVVLSEESAAQDARSGTPDRSWAWVDLFRQEIGPTSVRDVATLETEVLDAHAVVMITRSAAKEQHADQLMDHLVRHATNGGVVGIELPEGALRARFGADGAGGWRRPDTITAAEGVPEEVASAMQQVPLVARFLGSTRPMPGARTILAMDGAPVIYAHTVGAGRVVVFDFEVGVQLSRLQQGTPNEDFRVTPRRSGQPLRTYDMASTPALIGATLPTADLIERYIAHVALGEHRPAFGLWPYPSGKTGALVTSHDARRLDGRPLWMSEHERGIGARSVTFVAAPADTGTGASLQSSDLVGHAAVLWFVDPAMEGLYRSFGLMGFRPLRQPLTLVGQMEQLEEALGSGADLRGVRVWDGRWTPEFVKPYRAMDAAELRYSASYGPPPGAPPGFLFGTCQPFTPMDEIGRPFRVLEIPVCFENPTTDEDIERLMESLRIASEHSWAVHVLTSADRFARSPDLDGFAAWRNALEFASQNDMWIGGAGELVAFQRRRSATSLHSELVVDDTERADTRVYSVEVESNARGLALAVPMRVGSLRFEGATRGGPAGSQYEVTGQVDTEERHLLGRETRLVPLNPGFTTISLTYRAE